MKIILERFLIKSRISNYAVAVTEVRIRLGKEYSLLLQQNAFHYKALIQSNGDLNDDLEGRIKLEQMLEEEEKAEAEAEDYWRTLEKESEEN